MKELKKVLDIGFKRCILTTMLENLKLIVDMLKMLSDKRHSGTVIVKVAYQDGGIRNFQMFEEKKITVL